MYFNYEGVAREANIPPEKLAELSKIMRAEFPHDDMMYELHILRACMAIRDGKITLDEALRSELSTKPA